MITRKQIRYYSIVHGFLIKQEITFKKEIDIIQLEGGKKKNAEYRT